MDSTSLFQSCQQMLDDVGLSLPAKASESSMKPGVNQQANRTMQLGTRGSFGQSGFAQDSGQRHFAAPVSPLLIPS